MHINVETLIAYGCDVNQQIWGKHCLGSTLHCAAGSGQKHVAFQLMDAKADVEIMNKRQKRALDLVPSDQEELSERLAAASEVVKAADTVASSPDTSRQCMFNEQEFWV